ncbi:MAG: TerB family tellurite resistance protein [Rhodospirillales bacterium]|nr:TerB family tellurite resistance protein [Rhodospirillales bacterium]
MLGNEMISRIRALLKGASADTASAPGQNDLQMAAAALLIEAAAMDGHIDEDERATIISLLNRNFGLSKDAAAELFEEAREKVADSHELYGFTRTVKDNFSHEDRVGMIEMLWEVAYADGELHNYESNLVRRVAGLIYVPDRESGEARKKVLTRLGVLDTAQV